MKSIFYLLPAFALLKSIETTAESCSDNQLQAINDIMLSGNDACADVASKMMDSKEVIGNTMYCSDDICLSYMIDLIDKYPDCEVGSVNYRYMAQAQVYECVKDDSSSLDGSLAIEEVLSDFDDSNSESKQTRCTQDQISELNTYLDNANTIEGCQGIAQEMLESGAVIGSDKICGDYECVSTLKRTFGEYPDCEVGGINYKKAAKNSIGECEVDWEDEGSKYASWVYGVIICAVLIVLFGIVLVFRKKVMPKWSANAVTTPTQPRVPYNHG